MKYTKEDIQNAVNNSNCYSGCLRYMKLGSRGGNIYTIKNYINFYKIDISHFDRWINSNKHKIVYSLEDIFANKVPCTSGNLKKKLYKNNLKEKCCENCNQDENWMGGIFSLILDHIDGDHLNNAFDNLRILCPNCNAILETHCGKNKRKIIKKCINCNNEIKIHRKQCQQCIDIDNKNKNLLLIEKIKNSNIDFTKFGWVEKAAIILNKKSSKVNGWIKNNMFEFYVNNCFKRKRENKIYLT